ncbi:hypothetical protein CCAX7_19820 [Capsulimonas corticalis]|uniref:Uncharacterized protein n=2 Tax=Capsulimonas corticalis TaxID=2219043 RepID=A0A402D2Q3_9BACT|nr:hypothetical protein CCAX7_19820 [Capsulimonas corticalis]
MTPFLWRPGHGPDPPALERMQEAFPKPMRLMGEPWFMTENRKMYPELMTTLPKDLSPRDLIKYLDDITSGATSFGSLDGEWAEWFHYLLPRSILRHRLHGVFSDGLEEVLITALVTQYPGHIDGKYPGFDRDILTTLGQWIMAPDLWEGSNIRVGAFLHEIPYENYPWKWYEASSDLSATLFFCWKYLSPQEIDGWLESVFAIKDAHWCAQILVWLLGAQKVLSGEITQPVQFEEIEPNIDWFGSFYLKGHYEGDHRDPVIIPFLPQANIDAFQTALRKHVTEALFFEWLDAIAKVDYLQSELSTLPDSFAAAYLMR